MIDSIELFVVTDMTKPPLRLTSDTGDKTYTHTITHPIPKQIIVFVVGDWSAYTPDTHFSIVLHSQSASHSLGALTNLQRFLYWEKQKYVRRSELDLLPKSETSLSLVVSLVGERVTNQTSLNMCGRGCGEITQNLNFQNVLQAKDLNPHETIKLDDVKKKRKSSICLSSPSGKRKKATKSSRRHDKENENTENSESEYFQKVKKENRTNQDSIKKKAGKTALATCKEVTCKDRPMPSSRWGHSMTYLTDHSAILIGGQGGKRQLCKDSIWLLNTETRKWRAIKLPTEGQRPELRLGHTTTHDPMMRCVYVYGGSKNTKWFHDVHMLDLDQWTWHLIKTNDKAPMRAYHTATLVQHELLVFGGIYPVPDPQPDSCTNDIHVFSPITRTWTQPVVTGNKPLPRSGHSATMFDNKLVVFGGWDFPVCYSELFILDTQLMEWTQPRLTGSAPKPRSWHGAAPLSSHRLLIHGGYDGNVALDDTHILHIDTLTWTQIRVDNSPQPRAGHSIMSLPFSHYRGRNDEVMMFGGGDNDDAYFKDTFSFTIPFRPKLASVKSEQRNTFTALKTANV